MADAEFHPSVQHSSFQHSGDGILTDGGMTATLVLWGPEGLRWYTATFPEPPRDDGISRSGQVTELQQREGAGQVTADYKKISRG